MFRSSLRSHDHRGPVDSVLCSPRTIVDAKGSLSQVAGGEHVYQNNSRSRCDSVSTYSCIGLSGNLRRVCYILIPPVVNGWESCIRTGHGFKWLLGVL